MKRGNHRENDIGLKLIRSAGKTDNDIYSLSEFREVINEAHKNSWVKTSSSIGGHPAHSIIELHIGMGNLNRLIKI